MPEMAERSLTLEVWTGPISNSGFRIEDRASETRKQKTEGRRKKAKERRQKPEAGNQKPETSPNDGLGIGS
jgi:hypothetical protein